MKYQSLKLKIPLFSPFLLYFGSLSIILQSFYLCTCAQKYSSHNLCDEGEKKILTEDLSFTVLTDENKHISDR